MRKPLILAWALFLGMSIGAEGATKTSIGYAFSQYLDYGHMTPVGIYLSLAGSGQSAALEADLAYHYDSGLNTVTIDLGPHFPLSRSGKTSPFIHVLGGFRFDTDGEYSSVSYGGMAGLGIDIPTGSKTFFRLGGDFQMFFFGGFGLKTLRLSAGFSF